MTTTAADGMRPRAVSVLLRGLSPEARAGITGVAHLHETRSTNDTLLAMPPAAIHGWVVFADAQSSGRGRHGRPWWSPPGAGLYLSLGWVFPGLDRAGLGPLSLRMGLALAEALAPWAAPRLRLKWPNDLLAEGSKLGGVLVETRRLCGAGAGVAAVVGVGVNLEAAPDRGFTGGESTTSLAALAAGAQPSMDVVRVAVVESLLLALAAWEPTDSSDWLPRWRALDALEGHWVSWIEGGVAHEGRAQGPVESGALAVRTATGERNVMAGEVRRVRAATAPFV